MLPEVEREVLLLLNRDTLDVYQLSSAKSTQMILHNNDTLALRLINKLEVNECYGKYYYGERKPCQIDFHPFSRYTFTISNDEPAVAYEETALRMRNSFISKVVVACLHCAGFLQWLRANPVVRTECHVELMFVARSYVDSCLQRAIPDDLLVDTVDALSVTELQLEAWSQEDLLEAQQFMHRHVGSVKTLKLNFGEGMDMSTTDFVECFFLNEHLERVDIKIWKSEASEWVAAYVERFIGAGGDEKIVPQVVIYNDYEAPTPRVCTRPVETWEDASTLSLDLDANLAKTFTSCELFEFKNRARQEVLRVYCATTRNLRYRFRKNRTFYLQVVELA